MGNLLLSDRYDLMKLKIFLGLCGWLTIIAIVSGCASDQAQTLTPANKAGNTQPKQPKQAHETVVADVRSVDVLGQPQAYQFAVEVSSPDTGCDQYADWWEVLDQSGDLIYRRILDHSHASEQPFVRLGGPISIQAYTIVFIRAHMSTGGYGGTVMTGSVQDGFRGAKLDENFALGIEKTAPQPSGCAF